MNTYCITIFPTIPALATADFLDQLCSGKLEDTISEEDRVGEDKVT